MSIFSNSCQELIDPNTKRVLTGEALETARGNSKWPRCGYQVKKAAKYCSKCGSPSPGGWVKCPKCGKWVGSDSNFCWNCQASLCPTDRPGLEKGNWKKEPGLLAQRFDLPNIKRIFEADKIQVNEGLVAVLLEEGKYKDLLKPGTYTRESLMKKIGPGQDTLSYAVVLIAAGEIVLPLRFEKLNTSEGIPFEMYTEVIVRLIPGEQSVRAFLANVMKKNQMLKYEALANILKQEISGVVESAYSSSTIDELFKDPLRHLSLEDEIQIIMRKYEQQFGIDIIRLASVEFSSKEYEWLREKAGKVELQRREFEFLSRAHELVAKNKMDEFKNEQDLEAYITQLSHEKDISDDHRKHELSLLLQAFRHEEDRVEVAYKMAKDLELLAQEMKTKIEWDDYTRDKLTRDKELQIKIKKAETDSEIHITKLWLAVKELKKRLERKDFVEQAEMVKDLDFKTLISVIPDEAQREQLLRMYLEEQKAGRSPQEILAREAGRSPAAARAMAELWGKSRGELEKEFKDRKKLSDEHGAQLVDILKSALEASGRDIITPKIPNQSPEK